MPLSIVCYLFLLVFIFSPLKGLSLKCVFLKQDEMSLQTFGPSCSVLMAQELFPDQGGQRQAGWSPMLGGAEGSMPQQIPGP